MMNQGNPSSNKLWAPFCGSQATITSITLAEYSQDSPAVVIRGHEMFQDAIRYYGEGRTA